MENKIHVVTLTNPLQFVLRSVLENVFKLHIYLILETLKINCFNTEFNQQIYIAERSLIELFEAFIEITDGLATRKTALLPTAKLFIFNDFAIQFIQQSIERFDFTNYMQLPNDTKQLIQQYFPTLQQLIENSMKYTYTISEVKEYL